MSLVLTLKEVVSIILLASNLEGEADCHWADLKEGPDLGSLASVRVSYEVLVRLARWLVKQIPR